MAVLLDLSNEIIILIASNISKPMHVLQLALVNRRIHSIAIQQLYGNLTFERDDYSTFIPLFLEPDNSTPSILRYNDDAPHSNLLRLSSMMQSGALPAGQTVTHLTIIVGMNHEDNKFQTVLSLLLPQLSLLKALTLEATSEDRLAWCREQFSLAPLSVALSASSQTLQSLDMRFSLGPGPSDGWTIGSLRHFSNLKYLSIQGSVLFGQYESLPTDLPFLESLGVTLPSLNTHIPSLASILPPGLKRLRLHWCMVEGLQCLLGLLVNFVRESMRVSCNMKEVVVQLNATIKSIIEQNMVDFFEAVLRTINLEAREGGLDVNIALKRSKGYHWTARQGPLETQGFFMEKLHKFMENHPDFSMD